MKAAVRRKYNDTLSIEEVSKPEANESEVLVKVFATTINRTDCAVLTGKPYIMRLFTGLTKPKLITPGTDFAGIITAVGKNVKHLKVDDKIFGFKDDGIASQAEYLKITENGNLSKMPENISFTDAVASIEGAHYAYNFIKNIKFKTGDKILLNGASGSIGSALLQILKQFDIEITAVCNTKNIENIKARGADHIVDYLKEDFTKSANKYDYVLDAVGKNTFGKCKPILGNQGVYISSELGPNGQNLFCSLRSMLWGKKKVRFPFPTDIKGSLLYMKNLLEKGAYKPLIDCEYKLEDIADAYKYVQTGEKSGNVILKVQE